MISPQNLAIAATAVGLLGQESDILRRSMPWSIGLLARPVPPRRPAVHAGAVLDARMLPSLNEGKSRARLPPKARPDARAQA